MMLTEDQAREKWCPFARLKAGVFGGAVNRLEPDFDASWADKYPTPCRCIASACMAWREEVVSDLHRKSPDGDPIEYPVGYCGLAGKPAP